MALGPAAVALFSDLDFLHTALWLFSALVSLVASLAAIAAVREVIALRFDARQTRLDYIERELLETGSWRGLGRQRKLRQETAGTRNSGAKGQELPDGPCQPALDNPSESQESAFSLILLRQQLEEKQTDITRLQTEITDFQHSELKRRHDEEKQETIRRLEETEREAERRRAEEDLRRQLDESQAEVVRLKTEKVERLLEEAARARLDEQKRCQDVELMHKFDDLQTEVARLKQEESARVTRVHQLLDKIRAARTQKISEAFGVGIDEGPIAIQPAKTVTFLRPQKNADNSHFEDSDITDKGVGSRPVVPRMHLSSGSNPSPGPSPTSSALTSVRPLPSSVQQPQPDSTVPIVIANTQMSSQQQPRAKARVCPKSKGSEATSSALESSDPLAMLEKLLGCREEEVSTLRGLLEASQNERKSIQAEAVASAGALAREWEKNAQLAAELQVSRADLGLMGDHASQLEDEALVHQVRVDSICKERVLLKEQLEEARAQCSRLGQEVEQKDASLQREMLASAKIRAEAAKKETELSDMRRQLEDKDAALRKVQDRVFELDTDDHAIGKVAELLAKGVCEYGEPQEKRRAAQRRLLVSLHPDKCPATRIATQLTQEVQRSRWWVS